MTDKKKFIFSNLLSFVLGIVIGAGGFGIVSNINKNEKVPEQTATCDIRRKRASGKSVYNNGNGEAR